jgi:hypothetical protein
VAGYLSVCCQEQKSLLRDISLDMLFIIEDWESPKGTNVFRSLDIWLYFFALRNTKNVLPKSLGNAISINQFSEDRSLLTLEIND